MYITKRYLEFPLDDNTILLINTISSAMDIVNKSTYLSIKKMEQGELDVEPDLLNNLRERGYIFEDEKKEDSYIEKFVEIRDRAMKKSFVKNYTICPTMGCNLRCIYCFEGKENHCNNQLMTDKQLNMILRYIDKSINEETNQEKNKKVCISLYGGEPLLPNNKKIVESVLNFSNDRNIEVRIITNGTTIPYYIEILKKYRETVIQITLDGAKEIHDRRRITANQKGTFDEIVKSIDMLIQSGIKVQLRTNIDKDNLDSIKNLIQFIKYKKWIETGLVFPYVSPVFDYANGTNNSMKESSLYVELLKLVPDLGNEDSVIKKVSSPCLNFLQNFFNINNQVKPWKLSYCEATSGSNYVFTPDGNIATCLMLAGKGKYQIGHFTDTGVHFYSDEVKKWSTRDIRHLSKCKSCKYGLICGGGCPIAAIDINSDIDCPICSDIEATMKVFIESKKTDILKQL